MRRLEERAGRLWQRLSGWAAGLEERRALRAFVFCALLAAAFLSLYALRGATPERMMDDYDYSFSWATGEHIAGWKDAVASQAQHYQKWGGRSVVHLLAQLFLQSERSVQTFRALNALVFCALLLEIVYLASNGRKRFSWTVLLAAYAALFSLVPFFGTVFLWLTGSCNYLWGTALALLPLLALKSAESGGWLASRPRMGFLMPPVFFLAGWTNENTAAGIFALMLTLLVHKRLCGRRVEAWQWVSLAAHGAGVAVMLLAPGNYARASAYSSGNLLLELARRTATVTAYGALYCGAPLLALLFLRAAGRAMGVKRSDALQAALLLGAFFSAYAMVASPVVSDRSYTGVFVLTLAAALSAAHDLDSGTRTFDSVRPAALLLGVFLLFGGWTQAMKECASHKAAWDAQVARISQAAQAGEESVLIGGVASHSRFTLDISLAESPDEWPSSTLSAYFGVKVCGGTRPEN